MDQNLMNQALRSVLGEGYEARSRATGGGSSKSPSPHDFLQARVSKSNPVGSDMHVPTTIGADKAKKPKGKLKSVEYVAAVSKKASTPQQRLERQSKVSEKLLAAGATGGVLSLPSLASHTKGNLREAGVIAGKHAKPAAEVATKTAGVLRPLKGPKVGAALAGTAAGLELAGLGGDFLGHHTIKQQRKAGVMKSISADQVPELVTFAKFDDDEHLVFGWCSVSKRADGTTVVDLQGDEVPIDEIEKSAYDYMLMSRKGGNQHARTETDEPVHVGDVVESMVFTPDKFEALGLPEDFTQGWWYGMKIFDDETWADVKAGKRAGFSIHGKGRRVPVEEPGMIAKAKKVDRAEQTKDIALGTAGAVAAGSGGTAALVPMAQKRGLIGAVKGDRVAGRLKTVGAIVGGTAGVYGGLHAAATAAKSPAIKRVPTQVKAKVRSEVGKAWSPVAEVHSPEQKRQRRARNYQRAVTAGSVGALGAAADQGVRAVRAQRSKISAATVAERQGDRARTLKNDFKVRAAGAQEAHAARVAAKPNQRGMASLQSGHLRRMNAMGVEHISEKKAAMKTIADNAGAHNAKAAVKVATHSRRAGKLAAASGVLAGAASLVRRKREGSWRPYPGTR